MSPINFKAIAPALTVGAFFMVDIENITVRYQSAGKIITALSSLSLRIAEGEYVAVVGPNGSGKTTLVRALCGMIGLADGEIRLLGKDLRFGKFGEDFFGNVGVVFQEPQGHFLMPSVQREIGAVLENLGLPIEVQKTRLNEISERFSLKDILDCQPERLSGGQMQIVNLACALATNPQILILDEPTTFLDLHYRNLLIAYLDALHKEGLTILHITQYPDEAINCSRACILDKGSKVFDGGPESAFQDGEFLGEHRLTSPRKIISKKAFGFLYDDVVAQDEFCSKIRAKTSQRQIDFQSKANRAELMLRLENVKYSYPKSDFSIQIDKLELFKNEIVGIIGPTGSGKSTLAYLLAGLYEPEEGRIYYSGKELADYPVAELRRAIGITWQMPDLAMLGPTVKEDIEFGMNNLGVTVNYDTQNKNIQIDIEAILKQVGLDGFESRIVDTLSGGEKRKLSIAGILATDPSYIILDEPSAFLDPLSQQELIKIIRDIWQDDRGILIIGHDLIFLSELIDRVIGMDNGRIRFDISACEFFWDSRYVEELGLPVDPMIAFRQKLKKRGIELPFGSLDAQRIADYLRSL